MVNMVQKYKISQVIFYIFTTILAGIYLIPVAWIISTSLRTSVNLFNPEQWIPSPLTFDHYTSGLAKFLPDLPLYVFNTVRIAGLSTFGLLLSCSLAGYALARFNFPGRNLWLIILLATLMIPGQVTMIPIYVFFRGLGWINTPQALIVPAFFGNAVATFFFRQYFLTIPRELEEAAYVDGANRVQTFWKIIVPVAKPAFISIGVLTLVGQWNGFFMPSIFLQTPDQWVLTQALRSLIGRYDSQWGEIMALIVLMSLPMVLLYLLVQRFFVEGITAGSLKG